MHLDDWACATKTLDLETKNLIFDEFWSKWLIFGLGHLGVPADSKLSPYASWSLNVCYTASYHAFEVLQQPTER